MKLKYNNKLEEKNRKIKKKSLKNNKINYFFLKINPVNYAEIIKNLEEEKQYKIKSTKNIYHWTTEFLRL